MTIRPLTTAVLLALAGAGCAHAAPALTLPAEVRGAPGGFVTVRAVTEGKHVRWVALTPGLSVFPAELLRDSRVTVVSAAVPGAYRLLGYTAAGDEPSEPAYTTVVIDGPTPPGPVPPPIPPTPPGPVDELTRKVRAALDGDTGSAADKAKWAAALAGFYAAMAKHVETGNVATVGDLLSDYRAAIPAILPADAIPNTRRVCGAEVATIAGEDADKKIDADLKGKLADLFRRLAKALEARP